jgi:hypothetical protein
MKRLPVPALFALLLAPAAAAQADYSFQIDSSATNFVWSGTTSVGNIDEQPPNFTLAGDSVLTLDGGGSPVGSGAFANDGDALITPDLHGEIPNPLPFLPPLATIDLIGAHIKFSSTTFTVNAAGGFNTVASLTFISGTVVIDDITGGHTVMNLAGMSSNPEPVSGSVTWNTDRYHLDATIHAVFDFDDPNTGITGTVTLDGSMIADHTPTPPATYCPGAPNSVGPGASLWHSGSTSLGNADLDLTTSGLPANQFGLHFYGPTQANVPFGNGFRCVGPPLVRLKPKNTGALGEMTDRIDNSLLPGHGQLAVGMTRHFQNWYRDPAAGGAQFNTSNGLTVVFTP